MIYICEECDFLFFRMQPQTECPFCERKRVREATDEERERFEKAFAAAGSVTIRPKK